MINNTFESEQDLAQMSIAELKDFMDGCEENTLKGLETLVKTPSRLFGFTKTEILAYLDYCLEYYQSVSIDLNDRIIREAQLSTKYDIVRAYLMNLYPNVLNPTLDY